MFFSTNSLPRETIGSHSKLKRRSLFSLAFFKSTKRLNTFFLRDGSLLLLLFSLTLFLHFRQHLQVETTYLEDNQFMENTDRGHHDAVAKRQTKGPPEYLPLAQYLKHISISKGSPSLQDMVYGVQRWTQKDLKPTKNKDLENCVLCRMNSDTILSSAFSSPKLLKLARLIAKLVTFYDISSLLVFPCAEEAHWIFPLVKVIKSWNPSFQLVCVVPGDALVVDLIKNYGLDAVNGTRFVRYTPSAQGILPKVDMMFSWKGLEQFSLDDIHQVFKDVALSGIKYTLVGSTPGHPNAKLVETSKGVFSVVRPEIPTLNVRAFPFGFNKAQRVISLLEMQLLFYNSSLMRDTW